jgi:two-component system sensor histidine kinase EvgS
MKILIVDDHEENCYLLESILKSAGHTVHAAANGAEALAVLQEGGIDLIVSDILMPVMDGFQLCRKVKGDESLRHIPFIFYTATYTGSKDEEFALKIGADRFLVKPCEPEVFIAAVEEVLAAHRHGDAPAAAPAPEEEVLKLYSERLVRKLEQKMAEAEREIEARREAERSLRQSEEKYRRIFENSVVGIFQSTPQGRFIKVNPTFAQMLGYDSPEEVVSAICDIATQYYVHPEDRRRFQQALEARGHVENFEFQARRKDGTVVWFSNSARVDRGKDGAIEQYEGIVLDIGERKQAEAERERLQAQLLQAQKLEAVGRLAGGVAHDFNNMIGVILGYAEIALTRVDPADPTHGDLDEILSAARRATDITRQLLAFARGQTAAPRVLDLNESVEATLKMLRRLIGEDIDLAWRPGAGLWSVKFDSSQLDQLLANLCINARDAIAGVGKVTIETANVNFNQAFCDDHPGFAVGQYVMLAVSDDGCGMDGETRCHLFEPFFTTKPVGQGTGLGLATVYGIVRQNEGFINVYSEPGQGTTFKIYLPRHVGPSERIGDEASVETPMGRGETLLLVEDETAVLKLGQMMLAGLGYRVLAASGANEALALAEAHAGRIHLLITDVVMPEMNGRQLADGLKRRYPELKVLFMSGYTADIISDRGGLEDGINFLQKPFSRQELAVKVAEALGQMEGG